MVDEIFAVEERRLGHAGEDEHFALRSLEQLDEDANVGELEVDGGLELFLAGGLRRSVGRGVEVAVNALAPRTDVAKRSGPVEIGTRAVAEIGEDGAGFAVGRGDDG